MQPSFIMVRSYQATTFSSAPYFDDRGPHGHAEPITERVNVSQAISALNETLVSHSLQPHSRPVVSYYFPKGVGAQHYGVRNE